MDGKVVLLGGEDAWISWMSKLSSEINPTIAQLDGHDGDIKQWINNNPLTSKLTGQLLGLLTYPHKSDHISPKTQDKASKNPPLSQKRLK